MRFVKLPFAALVAATLTLAAGPARALDPIDFELAASPEDSGKAGYASDDDDEDAFFSSSRRHGTAAITGTIGSAAPAVRATAAHPHVDVAATCRAVLADNLTLYNQRFIDGCKRAVADAGQRHSSR